MKTVCMSIVFFAEQMMGRDIIYCVVYVRVKLNSWHWNIEALFKKKEEKKTRQDIYLNFLLLILTDVLLSFVLEFEWGRGGRVGRGRQY